MKFFFKLLILKNLAIFLSNSRNPNDDFLNYLKSNHLDYERMFLTNSRRDSMKKVVALLALLFGASVSVLAHADVNQMASDNTQQSTTTPQSGDQSNTGSSTDSGSTTNSGSDSNSSTSPSSSDSDDDTAS